ncbi:hypothetical protein RIF29_21542 [Crotalaria pallida]|uniref:Uncharacterized protein n=1 Tax=Crotalaria pallida TaxID=3830 RepID=A0AAN9FBP9_CROPI
MMRNMAIMDDNPNTDSGNAEAIEVVGESSEGACIIATLSDLGGINFRSICQESITKYFFLNHALAYEFYKAFATVHGFSIRKNKLDRNKDGALRANLAGGYDKVGYRKRDMYNKIHILRN